MREVMSKARGGVQSGVNFGGGGRSEGRRRSCSVDADLCGEAGRRSTEGFVVGGQCRVAAGLQFDRGEIQGWVPRRSRWQQEWEAREAAVEVRQVERRRPALAAGQPS